MAFINDVIIANVVQMYKAIYQLVDIGGNGGVFNPESLTLGMKSDWDHQS